MSTLRELAEVVQAWHAKATGTMQQIIDTPADTEIRLGTGDDPIVLDAGSDKAKGFRMGIAVALGFVAKLPFSIDAPAEPDPIHVKVMEVLVEILGIDGDEDPSCALRDDFGADDLDINEIQMKLGEVFEIDLQVEVQQLTTVQDMTNLVRKAIAEKATD